MPIYEYQCTSCHHQFECIQKMSAESTIDCPHCSKHSAERQISAAGFQLKGTGWYATDFKDKKPASTTGKNESATQSKE